MPQALKQHGVIHHHLGSRLRNGADTDESDRCSLPQPPNSGQGDSGWPPNNYIEGQNWRNQRPRLIDVYF